MKKKRLIKKENYRGRKKNLKKGKIRMAHKLK